jgi:hypothetical protein
MAKQMIKRKDGSVSQRGLWDKIRANKGSGKKPTKQMLQQEKKIKAKSMQAGGVSKKSPKAGLVDPQGAWTKVQKRNLPPAPMKKGGTIKKAQPGIMKKGGKVSMMKKMSKKK